MADNATSQAAAEDDEQSQDVTTTTNTTHTTAPSNDEKGKHLPGAGENEKIEESDSGDGDDNNNGDNETDNEEEEEEEEGEEEEEDEEDEEEDKESTLKYAKLTSDIASVYNGGDLTSAVLTTGNMMVIGTHNGIVHIYSLPNFERLRDYKVRPSSVTAISTSPFTAKASTENPDPAPRQNIRSGQATPNRSAATNSMSPPSAKSSRHLPSLVPATPSNQIYIATSTIDGYVCVQHLVDTKDVILKSFGRPVHAVALSPEYKSDRTFLSAGTAGKLILTIGGRAGVRQDASTTSVTSGWLESIGIGSSSGKDQELHSGEGAISAIKWSCSGKYVAWVNEHGIKIMRSHLHLDSADSELSWRRISHIPKPNERVWEDMAGVWKARVEWLNLDHLENKAAHNYSDELTNGVTSPKNRPQSSSSHTSSRKEDASETLVVGWGDAVWVLNIDPKLIRNSKRALIPGSVSKFNLLRFPDGIISGCTLYKPSVLLALVYHKAQKKTSKKDESSLRRGISQRQSGLPLDVQLIDLDSKEELESEELKVGRFESLSVIDYSMTTLFVPEIVDHQPGKRGAIEAIGSGIWDAGINATRLFSSGAGILSRSDSAAANQKQINRTRSNSRNPPRREYTSSLLSPGLKIFIQTPYDCILAVKKDRSDHLKWLLDRENYESAWKLVDRHPEVVPSELPIDSRPGTPTPTPAAKGDQSLADFFADESFSHASWSVNKSQDQLAEIEKGRIGNLWVQRLVSSGLWGKAGTTAGKVLRESKQWEHWLWVFIKANKFDEISPHVPAVKLKPPLSSEVYEVILGHYIRHDRLRLKELIDQLDFDLFDVNSITKAMENKLESGDIKQNSEDGGISGRDWHIVLDCLARLYLANEQVNEAFRCYVKTQNVDAALSLVRHYDGLESLSDNIYEFVLLRVSKDKLADSNTPATELEELSSEPIEFLLKASIEGIVDSDTVVTQLKARYPTGKPFLFFYLRALWLGGTSVKLTDSLSNFNTIRRSKFDTSLSTATVSRVLLAPHGDLAIDLFANFSREVLADFLRNSPRNYDFEHARRICRERNFIPELVHLLAAVDDIKGALRLILEELDDVGMAIAFAKEIDEKWLWEDLLDYGLDKPHFVKALLEGVGIGTAIDPVNLVKQIPESLTVEGLKESLTRLLHESEVTWSISNGAARVLRSEIAARMDIIHKGRSRGVLFELPTSKTADIGLCTVCSNPYTSSTVPPVDPAASQDNEYILGFPCGHIFHLSCLLDEIINQENKMAVVRLQSQLNSLDEDNPRSIYSIGRVGNKTTAAQMIAHVLGKQLCPVCEKAV